MGAPNNALSPIKSIQRSYTAPPSGAGNITISAVNMAKTVVECYAEFSAACCVSARLTTTTNVAVNCSTSGISLIVTVIEYN